MEVVVAIVSSAIVVGILAAVLPRVGRRKKVQTLLGVVPPKPINKSSEVK